MKHLPIGINTLATIIEQDMVYVDKTRMAWHLINQPSRFFLSRPRRFGESLFVDTLNESFSTICGYTPTDLQSHFADHLADVDIKKLAQWYNGYRWLGSTPVYNPFDILLFIRNHFAFRNYWFETGNPSFLIKLFRQNHYFLPSPEGLTVTEEILEAFDIESINPVTLLFQSGYLTVEDTFTRRDRMMFRLTIPNQEVKIALNDHFINAYTLLVNEKIPLQDDLYTCLEQGDVAGLTRVIHRLFASIPWRNFTQNDLADYEGYYASVLYAFFSSLNATVIPEDITNHGQADLTVQMGSHIYVMEIKVVDSDRNRHTDMGKDKNMAEDPDINPALAQIRKKKYADKYRGRKGCQVHEVGLVFSRKLRNLVS